MAAPKQLTQAELETIRERCDRATPGPWHLEVREIGECEDDNFRDPVLRDNEGGYILDWDGDLPGIADDRRLKNGRFCVEARSDIPALLAHIAHLNERLAAIHERYERAKNELRQERLKP